MTWNPFKKKEEVQAPVEQAPKKAANPSEKKGRPTPKMKQAQAAGIRPLVPVDRKASAKAAKARLREKENAEYEAMQNGDINHMPKAERLPWRIYIRDYVDARFNLMYGYLIAVIIDVWLMWRKLKAKLIAKYGEQSVSKGSRSFSYAWSRSIQMRRWRLPKPRYPKRGHWPAD